MAIFTTSSYTATTEGTNLDSVNWAATFDSKAQGGFAAVPAASGVYPYVQFFRGGLTGSETSLGDTLAGTLESVAVSDTTTGGGGRATGGSSARFVLAMDLPGSDPTTASNPRTGAYDGSALTTADEFGGGELASVHECFGSRTEFGKVDGGLSAFWGASRGGMEALKYMRDYKQTPKCVVLWNPFVGVRDWDNVAGATQTDIAAMIPGFRDGTETPGTEAELNDAEKELLRERSPMLWARELPDIPYLVLSGTSDTTSIEAWQQALVSQLQIAAPGKVEYHRIQGGAHVFSGSALNAAANATIDFLSTHLRRAI